MKVSSEIEDVVVVIPEERVTKQVRTFTLTLSEVEAALLFEYVNGTDYTRPAGADKVAEVNAFGWEMYNQLIKLDFEPLI